MTSKMDTMLGGTFVHISLSHPLHTT